MTTEKLPLLVVDFDGLLDPSLTDKGWFDLGVYSSEPAKGAVTFLIDATEFFRVAIYGPRSRMLGGIQTIQCAIIFWVTMEVNADTMHELMDSKTGIQFPEKMPEHFAVAINGTKAVYGPDKSLLTTDATDFVKYWLNKLQNKNRSKVFNES
jgi:hypothetical protein